MVHVCFSKIDIFFIHLKLEIASAIPALNEGKIDANIFASHGLNTDYLFAYITGYLCGLKRIFIVTSHEKHPAQSNVIRVIIN